MKSKANMKIKLKLVILNQYLKYIFLDLWFDMYLKDRRPVVLTHNPFITFAPDPHPEYSTQVRI